jgi:hypothetical protein
MKLWRCEMSVDDEFEIEVGINGLKRKDLKGDHIWKKQELVGTKAIVCTFMCV